MACSAAGRLRDSLCNFLQIGDATFSKNILQLSGKKPCKKQLILIICGILTVATMEYLITYEEMTYSLLKGSYSFCAMGISDIMGIVVRIILLIGGFAITLLLIVVVPKQNSIISFVGKNSLNIYFLHIGVKFIIDANVVNINPVIGGVVSVLGAIGLSFFFALPFFSKVLLFLPEQIAVKMLK